MLSTFDSISDPSFDEISPMDEFTIGSLEPDTPVPFASITTVPTKKPKSALWTRTKVFLAAAMVVFVAMSVTLGVVFTRDEQSANQQSGDEIGTSLEALSIQCPRVGADPLRLETIGLGMAAKVNVTIMERGICSLWQVGPGMKRKPVARSYSSNDWEFYANDLAQSMTMDCKSEASGGCATTLPALVGEQYYELISLDYVAASTDILAARFLEQTTFGPTMESIQAFPEQPASWIRDQIDLPMFSHRAYYRKHMNARVETTSPQGTPTHPCKAGTHYRKYAFSEKDRERPMQIQTDEATGRKVLLVDGQARTVLNTTVLTLGRNNPMADGIYEICGVQFAAVGSSVPIRKPDGSCTQLRSADGQAIKNPLVFFDDATPPTNPWVNLDGKVSIVNAEFYPQTDMSQELLLETALEDDICTLTPRVTGWPHFTLIGRFNGEWYMHDPRWDMYENTIDNPKADGGGFRKDEVESVATDRWQFKSLCGNPEMTFINEHGCYLSSSPNVCSVTQDLEDLGLVQIQAALNTRLLRQVYQRSSRLLYSVSALRQDEGVPYEPPCAPGTRSRWIPIQNESNCTAGALGPTTAATFSRLLGQSTDSNLNLRDLFTPAVGTLCDSVDQTKFDFQISADSQCWQNVHQDHLQVFDFSNWLINHPGGRDAILQFALPSLDGKNARFELKYPAWHDMNRWHVDGEPYRISIGRFGDIVELLLPQNAANVIEGTVIGGGMGNSAVTGVVCGSPNEVATDPSLPGVLRNGAFDAATARNETTPRGVLTAQKLQIWMHAALEAPDQLRQRVAWAMSQLLVVSPDAVSTDDGKMTETLLAYYDIFVRHAFGNYRDVLQEVTSSPLMGEMLSYMGSRSTAYIWETERRLEYADENFAREVMQLFTIGLYELHTNGTRSLDAFGDDIHTYSNDEISEYARLYTGFTPSMNRGNIENPLSLNPWNPIDPMDIDIALHDRFPKLGLRGRYIGDGLPLCRDLPDKHFLKKSARYRLLGRNPSPKWLSEPDSWKSNDAIVRLQLNHSSALHQVLCNRRSGSECFFKGMVELEEDIDSCDGSLCDVQALRVVEVGETGVFYEYIHPPCVRFAFFDDGRVMLKNADSYYCEDMGLQEGTVACCEAGRGSATSGSIFHGERVNFKAAKSRCDVDGQEVCSELPTECIATSTCDDSVGQWTTSRCKLQVKIDLESKVAVVHQPSGQTETEKVDIAVNQDTKSFFRVAWNDGGKGFLSGYENTCLKHGCIRDESDNLCICDTLISDSQAYTEPPTRDEVLQLRIGAFLSNIEGFDKSVISPEVTMYSATNGISSSTIYEVINDIGITVWRRNVQSKVFVGDSGDIWFSNPIHMPSVTNPEKRDALHEVEAALDHYFHHKNMAPFVATHFAKRFGKSNPSPRYVESMAVAFRRGLYVDEETRESFGSGEYGDLEAMVAAMLLDREARDEVLDIDPTSGAVFEPFLRFLRVFRALEWRGDPDRPYPDFLVDLQPRIGQEPYQIPSVFSFFLPDYQPGGPIGDTGLTCPECQELTGPSSISLLNGIISLIKYGLDSIYGGFGRGKARNNPTLERGLGKDKWASGSLKFLPKSADDATDVVHQLSLLLTAGRLPGDKISTLEAVYANSLQNSSHEEALINLEQLIVTTPEFHASGLSDNKHGELPEPDDPQEAKKPYKAVVLLLLKGGNDSYNMLVPQNCPGSDLVTQYIEQRGSIALTEEERKLAISASNQPCSEFAIHPSFPFAKELYDSGDLSFFANTGVFTSTEMTKANFQQKIPYQLFSHNGMQHEVHALDGFDEMAGTGIMGRIATILSESGYSTNSIAVDVPSLSVQSEFGTAPAPLIVSRLGAELFSPRPESETLDIEGYTKTLNGQSGNHSSIFGDMWATTFVSAIYMAERFHSQLSSANLGSHWPIEDDIVPIPELVQKFSLLSKLIQTRSQRGVDRDFFYLDFGNWDHHRQLKESQSEKMSDLNKALEMFVMEMKQQGRHEDVTVVVTSDFGRTMTPNSGGGSDHAWAGNYFIIGGAVDGGQIHGTYPNDITPESELNLGRGRLMPTTSWDCIWNGISEWLGAATDEELDYILPNRADSAGSEGSIFSPLFTRTDLFVSDVAVRNLND